MTIRTFITLTLYVYFTTIVDALERFFSRFSLYSFTQGSITGAYTSLTEKVTPSFILLAVQDRKITCYVYELINGEVEVSKTEITKKEAPSTPAANPALLDSLLK